jgi:hypothetical protein
MNGVVFGLTIAEGWVEQLFKALSVAPGQSHHLTLRTVHLPHAHTHTTHTTKDV